MCLFNQVTIIGVGLIGGSLGKALKKQRLAKKIVGVVRRKKSIKEAVSQKAVDRATLNIKEGVHNADLVVISVPVNDIIPTIAAIAPYLKEKAIVTDVGSVKENIVCQGEKILNKKASFVGSHPIAGSEKKGVTHALNSLFFRELCLVTPTNRTDKQALQKIIQLWETLGAIVKTVTPGKHDAIIAHTSHLPHLISVTLVNTVLSKNKKLLSEYVGPGFKDTTRIAASHEKIWLDICKSNKDELLSALEQYSVQLNKIIHSLKHNQWQRLNSLLKNAKSLRNRI